MKAILIDNFGGVEKLKVADVQKPTPLPNEVQIEIYDAGVNPVDWKIREGHLKERLPHEFPLILGWDAAGVVSATGKAVKDFHVGDQVFAYCRKNIVKWGTYAEYICVEAAHTALKPQSCTFAQAAAIPLAGLTAWQAMFDAGKIKKEQNVLIHAGAGGVGGFAIQFAKFAGAKVYTTASTKNLDYVRELGAQFPIDYTRDSFVDYIKEKVPQGLDLVFDTMGGKTLRDSLPLLKPNGCVVSLLEQVDPALTAQYKIRSEYLFVRPDGAQLKHIAELIDSNKVLAPQIEEMPLESAEQALQKSKTGHTKGKIVLKIKG